MDLLSDFVSHLASTRPADNGTTRTYRWAASTLLEYLQSADPKEMDAAKLQAFVTSLTVRGLSPRSVRTAVRGSKAFLAWCGVQVDLSRLDLPKIQEESPAHLDRGGIEAYLAKAADLTADPHRTVLLLLPLTGCRVRELCTAPIAGVAKDGQAIVLCVRRKGRRLSLDEIAGFTTHECQRKMARVGLSDRAGRLLIEYLLRYRRSVNGSPWLFPGSRGPISTDSVRKALYEVRKSLNLPWLTTHRAGRHSLAMLLRSEGVPLDKIADALGHKNLDTTRTHYAQASAVEVAALTTKAQKT